jgi:glyoxalase-like protein
MLIGIDHIVIAVEDLDAAAAELAAHVGIACTGGGQHPRYGTANRLAWLGDSYIELVSVLDKTLAATSWLGRPSLAAMAQGGGFITWALASDDLDDDLAGLRARGAVFDDPEPGERIRPDGRMVRWRLALRKAIGPNELPFLIEHEASSAEWSPAERAERGVQIHPLGGPVRLRVLALPTPSTGAAMQTLGREAGLRFRPSLTGSGARDASIGDQVVRLAPTASNVTIELASPAGDDRDIAAFGIRWIVRRGG